MIPLRDHFILMNGQTSSSISFLSGERLAVFHPYLREGRYDDLFLDAVKSWSVRLEFVSDDLSVLKERYFELIEGVIRESKRTNRRFGLLENLEFSNSEFWSIKTPSRRWSIGRGGRNFWDRIREFDETEGAMILDSYYPGSRWHLILKLYRGDETEKMELTFHIISEGASWYVSREAVVSGIRASGISNLVERKSLFRVKRLDTPGKVNFTLKGVGVICRADEGFPLVSVIKNPVRGILKYPLIMVSSRGGFRDEDFAGEKPFSIWHIRKFMYPEIVAWDIMVNPEYDIEKFRNNLSRFLCER